MSDHSSIEWTDATWQPITGCSVTSPGCRNCYAMKLAGTRLRHHPSRAGLTQPSAAGPVWTGEVRFNADWLEQPLAWQRPRRIFVCAHGDLFHPAVPDEWIDQVFAVMALSQRHTYQVLTKQAARMRAYLSAPHREAFIGQQVGQLHLRRSQLPVAEWPGLPLPNVWGGVSAEDQQRADERIGDLVATPLAVRWVSGEPLLGQIDLREIPNTPGLAEGQRYLDVLRRFAWETHGDDYVDVCGIAAGVDWVVVGGESGDRARPMHPQWARSLRDQCAAASVPFLFKQWGEWLPTLQKAAGEEPAHFDRLPMHTWSAGLFSWKVGKALAGRKLDQVEHNGFPEVQ